MRRREFIAALGSAAAWPIVAGQAVSSPGWLPQFEVSKGFARYTAAFCQGLQEIGFCRRRECHDRIPELLGC
jgi:hypothetical protein